MRIVFASTGTKTEPVLNALLEQPDMEVVGSIRKKTSQDRGHSGVERSGTIESHRTEGILSVRAQPRSFQAMGSESFQARRDDLIGIPTYQVSTFKGNEAVRAWLKELKPDVLIVADFAFLIPQDVLAIPRFGGVNIHPSLLPDYRGSSPAQYAILCGETVSGVSIIEMSDTFDHGALLDQWEMPLSPEETSESFYQKAFAQASGRLPEVLRKMATEGHAPHPQVEKATILARKLSKEDGRINWEHAAVMIERQIRAFTPWPGSWTTGAELGNALGIALAERIVSKRIELLAARCEKNKLVPEKVKVEGKQAVTWDSFLHGYQTT